ncbi:MAG: hypothetical protein ACHQ50_13035 [Fimbriimonadales bacterium]
MNVSEPRMVELRKQDGAVDEHRLDVRRLPNGALVIRVFEPGKRAGIGLPGITSLAAMAGAIAKSTELRILTRTGFYSFRRSQEWVQIGHFSREDAQLHAWKASTAELLAALKAFGSKAA